MHSVSDDINNWRPGASYREMNMRNIYKYTTKDRMLVMSMDAFDFYTKDGPAPKMKITCSNYDISRSEGGRVTDSVDAYIPLPKFLVLAHDIESGVLARKKRDRMATGQVTQSPYFSHYGGAFPKNGDPTTCISKRLTVVDGLGAASFAFLATTGLGEVDPKTGLIIPKTGSKPTASVFVNFPDDKLKELSIIGRVYSEQFVGLLLQEQLKAVRQQREAYKDARAADWGYDE